MKTVKADPRMAARRHDVDPTEFGIDMETIEVMGRASEERNDDRPEDFPDRGPDDDEPAATDAELAAVLAGDLNATFAAYGDSRPFRAEGDEVRFGDRTVAMVTDDTAFPA